MSDTITKRLVIRAASDYNFENATTVPVNSNNPTEVKSDIGVFSVTVNIRDFDGAGPHQANSLRNIGEKTFLNGSSFEPTQNSKESITNPNLRLRIEFTPASPIKGSELLFGNDFNVPIRDYVPTTLLSTGLKFFTWFINKTIKGDIYNDKPYLYGLTLNSFNYISILKSPLSRVPSNLEKEASAAEENSNLPENLDRNPDNALEIPAKSLDRKSFFNDLAKCESFVFNDEVKYLFQFDSNFVKLGNSKYAVSIPTFGNKTFDIDVSSYANDKLKDFNWVIKRGGYEGVGHGDLGLVVNFALADETN